MSDYIVPLRHRYLFLEGRIDLKLVKRIANRIPCLNPETSRYFYVDYAFDSLPIPTEFNTMFSVYLPECIYPPYLDTGNDDDYVAPDCLSFREHHLATVSKTRIVVLSVITMPYCWPDQYLASGWKSICLIDFPLGVPEMIDDLEYIETWGHYEKAVCICNYNTWEAMVDAEPC